MSLFGTPTEHSPTEKVDASRRVSLEVAKVAGPRFQTLFTAVERVNTADKATNDIASFIHQQPKRVGGVVAGNAIAQPVAYGEAVDDDLLDSRLGYAKYNSLAYSAVEEAEAITRQAANSMAQPVQEAQPVPMPRSEYEMPTEVTAAGPQVPEEVSYASQLHSDMAASDTTIPEQHPAVDAIRKEVSDAYDLAA